MGNQNLQVFNKIFSAKAKDTAELIKEKIKNGEIDPAYIGIALKKLHKVAEQIIGSQEGDKEIKELIFNEFMKYREGSSKTVKLYGNDITFANRNYWDYSSTEDPYLEALKQINKQTSELIKLREEELQAQAKAWKTSNTPKGGEVFKLIPFTVKVDKLPKLEWEEAYAEVETNPPTQYGKENLRYKV